MGQVKETPNDSKHLPSNPRQPDGPILSVLGYSERGKALGKTLVAGHLERSLGNQSQCSLQGLEDFQAACEGKGKQVGGTKEGEQVSAQKPRGEKVGTWGPSKLSFRNGLIQDAEVWDMTGGSLPPVSSPKSQSPSSL